MCTVSVLIYEIWIGRGYSWRRFPLIAVWKQKVDLIITKKKKKFGKCIEGYVGSLYLNVKWIRMWIMWRHINILIKFLNFGKRLSSNVSWGILKNNRSVRQGIKEAWVRHFGWRTHFVLSRTHCATWTWLHARPLAIKFFFFFPTRPQMVRFGPKQSKIGSNLGRNTYKKMLISKLTFI